MSQADAGNLYPSDSHMHKSLWQETFTGSFMVSFLTPTLFPWQTPNPFMNILMNKDI